MEKRIAIITGASSGIGKSFANLLSGDASYSEIWLIARREDRLKEIIDNLSKEDRTGLPALVAVKADLGNEEDIDSVKDRIESENPEIGMLINCAGLGFRGKVLEYGTRELESTIDINCRALSVLTRVCLPYMTDKSQTNRIINVASSAGFLPQPGFAAYAASKAYVISFSRALNCELKNKGVTVTAVSPGPVKTEFQGKATGTGNNEFTGFRAHIVADPDLLAKASIKAAMKGRPLLVYKFSQKLLHVASKMFPISLILSFMS